jgi:hypothetical protein
LREPYAFPNEQARWLREFQNDVDRQFAAARDFIGLKYLHDQPKRVFPGMIILADGTDFNPGSGAGMYRRTEDNTAWDFVG